MVRQQPSQLHPFQLRYLVGEALAAAMDKMVADVQPTQLSPSYVTAGGHVLSELGVLPSSNAASERASPAEAAETGLCGGALAVLSERERRAVDIALQILQPTPLSHPVAPSVPAPGAPPPVHTKGRATAMFACAEPVGRVAAAIVSDASESCSSSSGDLVAGLLAALSPTELANTLYTLSTHHPQVTKLY